MNDATIGRTLRALRHRRGMRQVDLAGAARVSRAVLSELEAGVLEGHTLGALRRAISASGGTLRLSVSVPEGDLERLLDADHAALQSQWLGLLRRSYWEAVAEATFSVYGERGSIDILGWHPATSTLVVAEVKTVIVDAGSMIATLDRKTRLGRTVARERGWHPKAVVPMLVLRESSTARRRITELGPLFARLSMRGRDATAWLRSPAASSAVPSGLLVLAKLPDAHRDDRRRAGRRRIRRLAPHPRSPAA